MIGAWIAALLLADGAGCRAGAAKVELSLERAHPRVGDRVVVTAALPVAAASASASRDRPTSTPHSRGSNRSSPRRRAARPAIAASRDGRRRRRHLPRRPVLPARRAPTARAASRTVARSRPGRSTSRWRRRGAPAARAASTSGADRSRRRSSPRPRRWPWFVALAGALALAAAWIARAAPRRRAFPLRSSRRRDRHAHLARRARPARREHPGGARGAPHLVERPLARAARRTRAPLARRFVRPHDRGARAPPRAPTRRARCATKWSRCCALADDGKFARPSAGIAIASSAVTEALRLLEETARAPADPS